MRAAIGQRHQGLRVAQHFAHGVEIALGVIGGGQVEQGVAVIVEQGVVAVFFERQPCRFRPLIDAVFALRLVVGHILPLISGAKRSNQLQRRWVGIFRAFAEQLAAEIRFAHSGDALGQRQIGNRLVTGVAAEAMQAEVEPEKHADRARRNLPANRQAVGGGLSQPGEVITPPRTRLTRHFEQGERHRPPAVLGNLAQQRKFDFGGLGRGGNDLEHAGLGIAQSISQRAQFVDIGIEAGRKLARAGAVHYVTRGGDPKRTGADSLSHQPAHLRQIVGGRRFLAHSPITHHIDPQC